MLKMGRRLLKTNYLIIYIIISKMYTYKNLYYIAIF